MADELLQVASIVKSIGDAIMLSPNLQQKSNDLSSPDRQIEASLIFELQKNFPEASFFAEEQYKTDVRLANVLQSSGKVFIIDPIDNTTAFLDGKTETAAVMVALLDGQKLSHGWIYYPKHSIMLYGQTGFGSFHNGVPIKLPSLDSLNQSVLAVFPNTKHSIESISDGIDSIRPFFSAVRERGSVCEHALDILVNRTSHVLLNRVPWPWDTHALFAIYAAARGVVGMADGGNEQIHGIHRIGQILAPNDKIYSEATAIAREKAWPSLLEYNKSNTLKSLSWGAPAALGD